MNTSPPLLQRKCLSLSAARAIGQAAAAEAARHNWAVSIAVVDNAGALLHFERTDGAGAATIDMAQGKAWTSVNTKVPTRLLEEGLKAGRMEVLVLRSVTPLQGGLPVEIEGEVVGAVGVAGVHGEQDEQCARAGLEALRAT